MKKEFLTFVIGVLIGAIIATGVFLVLEMNDDDSSSDVSTSMEAPSGDMENMEDGDFDPNSVGGERPDNDESNEVSDGSDAGEDSDDE